MQTKFSKHPDQELVALYLKGNQFAFEELLKRYKNKVYSSIYLFVKDKYLAEDLFQETFIKAVNKLKAGKYQEEGKFLPWIMRIAHNNCIDFYRKTKRHPKITTTEGFDIFNVLKFADTNAEQRMIQEETTVQVKKLIDRLPEEQKEVLILRHYSELSFKEISDITGVSINTALGRMRYALINLRKMLQKEPAIA